MSESFFFFFCEILPGHILPYGGTLKLLHPLTSVPWIQHWNLPCASDRQMVRTSGGIDRAAPLKSYRQIQPLEGLENHLVQLVRT